MSWKDRFRRKGSDDQSSGGTKVASGSPPSEAAPGGQAHQPGWLLQPGQLLLRTYRIEGLVGSPGGMGQVFKAKDETLGLTVAVKVPTLGILAEPDGTDRFLREARTAARLSRHPHVVSIKACLTDPDLRISVRASGPGMPLPFFVMEYLGGGDLAQLLAASQLDLATIGALFGKMCSAVHHAHSYVYEESGRTIRGVVHRDLKPENVCFDDSGRLVVVDFGLARLRGDLSKTRMSGTPSHMSPEQWRGADVDHRTDIYALGVVLYQMVASRLPFIGTHEQVMLGHLTKAPEDPRRWRADLPESVANAVLRALNKDKDDRFDTAEEFGRVISDVLARRVETRRPEPPAPAPQPPARAAEGESLCSRCGLFVTSDLVGGRAFCSNCGVPRPTKGAGGGTPPDPRLDSHGTSWCPAHRGTVVAAQIGVNSYCPECGVRLDGPPARQEPDPPTGSPAPDPISAPLVAGTCPRCREAAAVATVAGRPYCGNCGAPWSG